MAKYTNYLTIDTETATLPFVNDWELSSDDKKKVAIAKPLIYDVGWTIANRTQGIVEKKNFLVAEIFSIPNVFNTAYYAYKRPLYLDMIRRGAITVLPWDSIMEILISDLEKCDYITAYNIMFDMKKAFPFTELYIRKLYSPDYYSWEELQKRICRGILTSRKKENEEEFDKDNFIFRGKTYPMIDVWGLACMYILNNGRYKKECLKQSKVSNSGLYFSTNAEVAMQYLSSCFDFVEDHTALSDAEIETKILFNCLKRGKLVQGITYFPFKMLGNTDDFIMKERGITKEMAENVIMKIRGYLPEDYWKVELSPYQNQVAERLMILQDFASMRWGD